jgi:hypothetical protein
MLQRNIGDLDAFLCLRSGNTVAGFGDFTLPPPTPGLAFEDRMSDLQLPAREKSRPSLS